MDIIQENDSVMVTGGGLHKCVAVKKHATLRLGRVGVVQLLSLVGLRFGEVVQFDEKKRIFAPSDTHPDLDKTDIAAGVDEYVDNRNLEDTFGAAQQLTHDEVKALKEEKGVAGLLEQLVEGSTTFSSKTVFSQEKYIRKKKVKYALLFKIDRVTPDSLAEQHIPTIRPSDQDPEECRFIRLRCDAIALILHHADIHNNSRVVCYEKTNGVLPAAMLNRLGPDGIIFQVMDKVCHPNTVVAREMKLPLIKERWKAVPRNQPFLTGEDYDPAERAEGAQVAGGEGGNKADENQADVANAGEAVAGGAPRVAQWVRGKVVRDSLTESPADSLVIVDDEDPISACLDFMQFLSLSGHLVVYCNFLDQLTELFKIIRNDFVCIRISETWYRHHQVLSNRTHPTVNMSTAAGYILTAIKVETNTAPKPRYTVITDEAFAKYNCGSGPRHLTGGAAGKKRPREE